MKLTLLSLAGVVLLVSASASAQSADDLLKKHACTACHSIDKKGVGPAYNDVSTKYKGNAGAPAMLADKVKKGGTGTWGAIPMPPNTAVPDADIKTMVGYILALKK